MIVESPNKVKKIKSILGPGWRVEASVGHIRDLPEDEIGFEPPSFKPKYVLTTRGRSVSQKLKAAAANADEVYLATDPDREGEAISWHLKEALKLGRYKRVAFNELTKKAIEEALANPRQIDDNLFRAQEARRVIDRDVGYGATPVLRQQTGNFKATAGRVQSPALWMLVTRERAIKNFKAQKHFRAEILFDGEAGRWKAEWDFSSWTEKGQNIWLDKAVAEQIAAIRDVQVVKLEDTKTKKSPPPPFTTDTLLQAASVRYGMSPEQTMTFAQEVFAAGYINYHRTDSPNLSDEAISEIRKIAAENNLPLPNESRRWKAPADAQEGHEAIRPLHFEDAGKSMVDIDGKALSSGAHQIYQIIRDRAIASQLADSLYDVRTATLNALELVQGKQVTFVARGTVMTFKGWQAYFADDTDEDAADKPAEAKNPVPSLQQGQNLTAIAGRSVEATTTPPERYTEASLVKALKSAGIGRPSTYASITKTIKTHQHAEVKQIGRKKCFVPTELAEVIVDALDGKCSFIQIGYTKALEEKLDAIAAGKLNFLDVVAPFHNQLMQEIGGVTAKRMESSEPPKPKLVADDNVKCPLCTASMVKRPSKFGEFYGCSGFPKCKGTRKVSEVAV